MSENTVGDLAEVLGDDYNPQEHESIGLFLPIPPAWYTVEITKAEVKRNTVKHSAGLNMELTVLGGEFNGRKIFWWINLDNQNTQCVEIGRKEIAALGQALGLAALRDSSVLIGANVLVKVIIQKDKKTEEMKNRVSAVKAITNVSSASATPAPQAAAPAPRAAAAAKRPWDK